MPVHKVVVEDTALIEAPTLEHAVNVVQLMSLKELGHELDYGEFLGGQRIASSQTLTGEQTFDVCVALGNDWSFFDLT